jgi:hypothetical protein
VSKRHHHFLPRFYLRGFVDPSNGRSLWQYDKQALDIRETTPTDAAVQKHFYSFKRADGTRDTTSVEDALMNIEDQTAPIYRQLLDGEPLDNTKRSVLSYFFALVFTRVPVYRAGLERFAAAIVKDISHMMSRRGAFDSIAVPSESREEIDRAKAALRRGEFDILVDPQISLPAVLGAGKIAPILHAMTWAVIQAPRSTRFITCDNPIVYVDPKLGRLGPGLVSRSVEVTLPLSTGQALMAGWSREIGGVHRTQGRAGGVREINRRTAANAGRFVYASERNEGLLRLVRKYRDVAPRIDIS